jgi:hypothetical protein
MLGIGHLKALKDKFEAKSFEQYLRNSQVKPLICHKVSKASPEVIVSLTTYGKRLQTVDLSIKSILAGEVLPDRIILWIDKDTKGDLPKNLLKLKDLGVEIRRDVNNLKPHTKYFYAISENPSSIVITIDDDVMYPQDTISSLMTGFVAHPGCVIARRVHRILWNESSSKLLPYQKWDWQWTSDSMPRMDLLATGVGGVLYPPSALRSQVFDADGIKSRCLNADDLWLKVNEVLTGVPVLWIRSQRVHPWTVPNSQGMNLNSSNVFDGQNDVILVDILRYFGLSESEFIQRIKAYSNTIED